MPVEIEAQSLNRSDDSGLDTLFAAGPCRSLECPAVTYLVPYRRPYPVVEMPWDTWHRP